MITKLHIQNFQSHADSTFVFDDGINIIIGKSDTGKSAIWRALYWLAFNSPSGEAYRSHWGGDTLVEVWLDNGTHIQKVRTAKDNMYVLNGLELKALRTEVPLEIQDALGLYETNFQGQLDSSFLLMSSAGEVARVLNEYLDLQTIDQAIQDINTRARKNSSDLKALYTSESQLLEELEENKYARLEEYEERADALALRHSSFTDKQKDLDDLSDLLARYRSLKESLGSFNSVQTLLSKAERLSEADIAIKQHQAHKTNLLQKLCRAEDLQKQINSFDAKINLLENQKTKMLKDKCPACGRKL